MMTPQFIVAWIERTTPRSNAEKRDAVDSMLRILPDLSIDDVARRCKVSVSLVRSVYYDIVQRGRVIPPYSVSVDLTVGGLTGLIKNTFAIEDRMQILAVLIGCCEEHGGIPMSRQRQLAESLTPTYNCKEHAKNTLATTEELVDAF